MSEQSKSLAVATIVPAPKSNPNDPHHVMGTQVLLSDGSELSGVTSVVLKASVESGAWEAVITLLPREVPTVDANAEFVTAQPQPGLADLLAEQKKQTALLEQIAAGQLALIEALADEADDDQDAPPTHYLDGTPCQ